MLPANVMNNLVITHYHPLQGLFRSLSQETTLGHKVSMFVEHKALSTSAASPKLLL